MKWVSGFWRRIGAFAVDAIILGVVGLGLGLMFEKQFVELGGWGRIVGFFVAFVYFGIMNSKVADGQTLGKKLFKIKVVNIDNQPIDIGRSFARYSILGIPFFLNGAHLTSAMLTSYWLYLLSCVVFGGLFSVVYLYIFNRATRQTLHDLIVGTLVVNVATEKQETGVVWKLHLIIVCVLFAIATLAPVFASKFVQSEPFRELISAQAALMNNPSVSYATVSYGQIVFSSSNEGKMTTTYVTAQTFLKQNAVTDAKLARALAELLVSNYSDSLKKDVIQVNLIYGYDIGIAYRWSNQAHNFNPKEFASR